MLGWEKHKMHAVTSIVNEPELIIDAFEEALLVEIYMDNGIVAHFFQNRDLDVDLDYLHNTTKKISLKANACLNHIIIHAQNNYKMDNEQFKFKFKQKLPLAKPIVKTAFSISQETNSHYKGTLITAGGNIQNVAINNFLLANNAHSDLRILQCGRHPQKMAIQVTTHHLSPYTLSNTVARGIMDKNANGHFSGKIIVAKNAVKTVAKLENKNILLSKTAEMSTCPLLEIYNNDVQCSHGATVGHLDEEALFYLRSRGIQDQEAKQILIRAFIDPTLDNLKPIFIKNSLKNTVNITPENITTGSITKGNIITGNITNSNVLNANIETPNMANNNAATDHSYHSYSVNYSDQMQDDDLLNHFIEDLIYGH